jgi:hypothetical protein
MALRTWWMTSATSSLLVRLPENHHAILLHLVFDDVLDSTELTILFALLELRNHPEMMTR